MRLILTLILSFALSVSFSQNHGLIHYLNGIKAAEDIEAMRQNGLNFQIQPKLISVDSFPKINTLLEDYKSYISTYYRQINSITFLDTYQFTKLDKRNMRVQTVCYVQYKNRDYKWGGCKYFEIFYVNSDLYFTPTVVEYSDRYEMEVTVAEKINYSLVTVRSTLLIF